jgi:prolyl-tRNA synthetase
MVKKHPKKSENFSEWFTWICSEDGAQLADLRYGVQGFVVLRPWAYKIIRRIYELLEDEFESTNHEPFLFPTVIPEANLQKEKEHAGFTPDVFWITQRGDSKLEEKWALRPTGEAAIYPMYHYWLRSYNDLPWKGYQSRITVFRNEKTTRPFMRGREFNFLEAHNVFQDHKQALAQITEDMQITKSVMNEALKIPYIFLRRPQWDKFKGAVDTYCADTLHPDGRKNQMSSTHDLGQNFAKAFDIKVKDEKEKNIYPFQTCFGPGIWRIMAALISIHGDDNGLVLPFTLAPIKVAIIPITFSNKKKLTERVLRYCNEIVSKLNTMGIKAKLDDSDNSPGFKYNHYEMLGVPLRIEIGPREVDEKTLTIVRRTDKKKVSASLKNLVSEVHKQATIVDNDIDKAAKDFFDKKTQKATTFKQMKDLIEKDNCYVKVPFCSIEDDGEACADQIKEKLGADVGGSIYGSKRKPLPDHKCVMCGKKAKVYVYVGKSL